MAEMDTKNMFVDFGTHRGERYTRVPVSYLKWMVNVGHTRASIAKAELERRGTVTPDVEVSGHAIDRASIRCLAIWERTRIGEEGLHAWLVRMSDEALRASVLDSQNRFLYCGMKFAFADEDLVWPVLKTVMPA